MEPKFDRKRKSKVTRALTRLVACVPLVLAPAACASADGGSPSEDGTEHVIVAPEQQGIVRFETLEAKRVTGAFEYRGVTLRFDSETTDAGHFITLELRGMTLTATIDPSGVFDLDGYQTESGVDTQMTEVDKVVIHSFEIALTELYQKRARELPALDMLNRLVALWGDYSLTVPLNRVFYGRNELIVNENLCAHVNKAHQGVTTLPLTVSASHDCTTIKHAWSDCAAITAGCMHGDDSATIDRVVMSMHPDGSCSDGVYFGTTISNFRCYEPDHDPNVEFSYGSCFGRCGPGCGGGTQFTGACLDHDECVRVGHWLVSPDCDDDFLDASVDFVVAANCDNVNFTVNWNNAGGPNEGNCPLAWKNSNDGCDVGCQFIDGDCFR